MRFTAVAAAILPVALAWNSEICNGVGGCMTTGGPVRYHPFVCPDGSRITRPELGNDLTPAGYPGAAVVSKEDYPTSCSTGVVPGANDILLSVPSRRNQTIYAFITEVCTHPNPAPHEINNCYTYPINDSKFTFCQLIDSTGQECAQNPNAGRCERWGATAGRDECRGWEPGMPDFPDSEL